MSTKSVLLSSAIQEKRKTATDSQQSSSTSITNGEKNGAADNTLRTTVEEKAKDSSHEAEKEDRNSKLESLKCAKRNETIKDIVVETREPTVYNKPSYKNVPMFKVQCPKHKTVSVHSPMSARVSNATGAMLSELLPPHAFIPTHIELPISNSRPNFTENNTILGVTMPMNGNTAHFLNQYETMEVLKPSAFITMEGDGIEEKLVNKKSSLSPKNMEQFPKSPLEKQKQVNNPNTAMYINNEVPSKLFMRRNQTIETPQSIYFASIENPQKLPNNQEANHGQVNHQDHYKAFNDVYSAGRIDSLASNGKLYARSDVCSPRNEAMPLRNEQFSQRLDSEPNIQISEAYIPPNSYYSEIYSQQSSFLPQLKNYQPHQGKTSPLFNHGQYFQTPSQFFQTQQQNPFVQQQNPFFTNIAPFQPNQMVISQNNQQQLNNSNHGGNNDSSKSQVFLINYCD